jgi:hypothetical protein
MLVFARKPDRFRTLRPYPRDLLGGSRVSILASHVESATKTAYLPLSTNLWVLWTDNSHFGLCSSHLLFLMAVSALVAILYILNVRRG